MLQNVLGAYFVLPESSHKSIYYIGIITELCKLSPSTVGPAVGKSIRKLYSTLGEGLDVEVARRFAEWFAVHMSNFGFQWVWKEWCACFLMGCILLTRGPGYRTSRWIFSILDAPSCVELSSSKFVFHTMIVSSKCIP
jgi:hypothetical protein